MKKWKYVLVIKWKKFDYDYIFVCPNFYTTPTVCWRWQGVINDTRFFTIVSQAEYVNERIP